MYDIKFRAWNLALRGLHDLKLKTLHVIRHIGLRDIRVVVQLVTDLEATGRYSLNGTGLSLVPLSGGLWWFLRLSAALSQDRARWT